MRLNTVATGPTSIHKHTHTAHLNTLRHNATVILRVPCGVHKAIFVYTLFLLATLLFTSSSSYSFKSKQLCFCCVLPFIRLLSARRWNMWLFDVYTLYKVACLLCERDFLLSSYSCSSSVYARSMRFVCVFGFFPSHSELLCTHAVALLFMLIK